MPVPSLLEAGCTRFCPGEEAVRFCQLKEVEWERER